MTDTEQKRANAEYQPVPAQPDRPGHRAEQGSSLPSTHRCKRLTCDSCFDRVINSWSAAVFPHVARLENTGSGTAHDVTATGMPLPAQLTRFLRENALRPDERIIHCDTIVHKRKAFGFAMLSLIMLIGSAICYLVPETESGDGFFESLVDASVPDMPCRLMLFLALFGLLLIPYILYISKGTYHVITDGRWLAIYPGFCTRGYNIINEMALEDAAHSFVWQRFRDGSGCLTVSDGSVSYNVEHICDIDTMERLLCNPAVDELELDEA